MAWWRFVCRNQSSRSTRRLSPSGCEKTNSDKPFAGRGIICSARTSPRKIPACCGNTTFSSPRSKRLSGSEERFSHPPHLSPERLTHRGAYLRIVSGLLFVHHAGAAFAGAGAWSNSSSGAGENVRYSNGGCAGTHNRWAVADPVAVHPTRERSPDASPRIAPTVAGSTTAQDCPVGTRMRCGSEKLVVKTF